MYPFFALLWSVTMFAIAYAFGIAHVMMYHALENNNIVSSCDRAHLCQNVAPIALCAKF